MTFHLSSLPPSTLGFLKALGVTLTHRIKNMLTRSFFSGSLPSLSVWEDGKRGGESCASVRAG